MTAPLVERLSTGAAEESSTPASKVNVVLNMLGKSSMLRMYDKIRIIWISEDRCCSVDKRSDDILSPTSWRAHELYMGQSDLNSLTIDLPHQRSYLTSRIPVQLGWQ